MLASRCESHIQIATASQATGLSECTSPFVRGKTLATLSIGYVYKRRH